MNTLTENQAITTDPKKPSIYRLRYLCNGYTIADALRPQPDWGAKRYTVETEPLGDHTDQDLIKVAHETAPEGYWLHLIEAIGGDPHVRQVYKRPV